MSHTASIHRKKVRSCFYGEPAPPSGEQLRPTPSCLFVPTPGLWALHEAGKPSAVRARSEKSSRDESTVEAIAEAAGVTDAVPSKWLRRYKHLEWFGAWLLSGAEPPPHVRVITLTELEHARKAWDYRAHCRASKVNPASYDRWFKRGLIPDADWLDWLYGAPAPGAWLVVTEAMRRFRQENTHKAIARAAGISLALVSLWRKDPARREFLRAVVDAAERRAPADSLAGLPGWDKQTPATRGSMGRYAQAATLAARCERAEVTRASYLKWQRAARDVDQRRGGTAVEQALRCYLNPQGEAPQGRVYQAEGPVAPGLYIPTAAILRFREAASREMAEQKVRGALGSVPCFAAWMRDWTAPMQNFGKRSTGSWGGATQAVDDRLGGPPAGAAGPVVESTAPTLAREDQAHPQQGPHKGGRPTDERTQEIYQACYRCYVIERKGASAARRLVNRDFGSEVVKDDSQLRQYVRRFARKYGLPRKHQESARK